jgi:hypothetical protein
LSGNIIDIETSLSIAVVQVVNRQQMVRLRAHIGDTQQHIRGQLPLDREVVLFRILRTQMRLEFSV